jgi:Ion channel
MARVRSPTGPIAGAVPLLHAWRVILLCATLTHELEHPALALLMLVPLNHFLYHLTSTIDPAGWAIASRKATGPVPPQPLRSSWVARAGGVAGLLLIGSIAVVWWYGSLAALIADVKVHGRTWEWLGLVVSLVALNALYRPLVRALRHLVGATGLLEGRLWSALFLAIAVWIWCDGVFAALYQQLSLYCEGSPVEWCEGGRVFSESLARFVDAAYFSTITLSTTGFGDILPLSDVARALVAIEIIIGFGLLGFLLSRVAGYVSPASDSGGPGRPEHESEGPSSR